MVQAFEDERHYFPAVQRWQSPPLVGMSASVHEYTSACARCQSGKHLVIPGKSVYVIHDFDADIDGCLCGRSLISVDRDYAIGSLFKDAFNHRQHAPLLLVSRDEVLLSRPRRFPADIDDVRALRQKL